MVLDKLFRLKELGTDVKTELIAGLTTFATLSYLLIIMPLIMSEAGMPYDAVLATTVIMGFIGSLLMGFVSNRPFAVAPLLAENVFLASTVILQFGLSWQQAYGAVCISAILFFLLTIFNFRSWLVNSLPACMKFAFTAGLGIYLAFVGLKGCGIIVLENSAIRIGNLFSGETFWGIISIVLILLLMIRKVKIAILVGIVGTTILSVILGNTELPASVFSMPPSIEPVFLKADILGAMNIQYLPIIFIVFVLMFVDTMGTMTGVAERGGFIDEKGNIPDVKKAMIADSTATIIAGSMSTITTGVYLESTSGIEAGGKSGLTAVTFGFLFLLGLFFTPLFSIIPTSVCNSVLVIIGILMFSSVTKINFNDITEYAPALLIIFIMAFSGNIGIAVAKGFVLYPLFKLTAGKYKEISAGAWIFFVISIIFFLIYKF